MKEKEFLALIKEAITEKEKLEKSFKKAELLEEELKIISEVSNLPLHQVKDIYRTRKELRSFSNVIVWVFSTIIVWVFLTIIVITTLLV